MNPSPATGCGTVAGWVFSALCVADRWAHMALTRFRVNCQAVTGGICRGAIGACLRLRAKMLILLNLHKAVDFIVLD